MRKREIFNYILDCIVNEAEINASQILSSNKNAEVVDARHILVYHLKQQGFYTKEIAALVGISCRAVDKMVSNFKSRLEFGGIPFRFLAERVKNKLQTYKELSN